MFAALACTKVGKESLCPTLSYHVLVQQAVVGAGAAGLVAARELRREGHQVTVFEQADQVGGVWVYTDEVEDDPTGVNTVRSTSGQCADVAICNLSPLRLSG